MYYGQDKRTYVEKRIRALREGASMIEFAKEIVREMDGKVLNVRLKNALNAGTLRYDVYVSMNTLIIECYPESRHCHEVTIASVNLDQQEGKHPRIDAKAIIDSMDSFYKSIMHEAQRMENALENIEEIKERLRNAVDNLNKITDGLPYVIIDTFNLPHKMHTHF